MDPAMEVFNSVASKSVSFEKSILYKVWKSELDPVHKSSQAMQNEIIGSVLAGTEAVANTLLTISSCLIQNPEDCRRLKHELQVNFKTDGKSIQQLPFLVSTDF
jgi:hypothetical protein